MSGHKLLKINNDWVYLQWMLREIRFDTEGGTPFWMKKKIIENLIEFIWLTSEISYVISIELFNHLHCRRWKAFVYRGVLHTSGESFNFNPHVEQTIKLLANYESPTLFQWLGFYERWAVICWWITHSLLCLLNSQIMLNGSKS